MSGIYIPGMEMPKSCCKCVFSAYTPTGKIPYCKRTKKDLVADVYFNKRDYDCPLIEVPPHGRLGDLDDVINDVRHYLCEGCLDYFGPDAKTESCDYCRGTMLIKTIERKSSIIPASGGKENE